MTPTISKTLTQLPQTPGVYYFYDQTGRLLYIGKAANLKRRVSSYWQKRQGHYPREFVPEIARLKYKRTDSVLEALILEANEIKAHQPPGNRDLKDDKTFVMIGLTDEPFPGIVITRPTAKLKVPLRRQFGPYPSATDARLALKVIRRIFPFRSTCKIPLSPFHSTSGKMSEKSGEEKNRGCLEYQLGLCPGPCTGAISQQAYQLLIRNVTLFLEGKKRQIVRTLRAAMKRAARAYNFETAARLRNQIFALQHLRDVSLLRSEEDARWRMDDRQIPTRLEAYDISNIGADAAVGSMVVLDHGKPDTSQYRKFQIKTIQGQNDLQMMEEVLTRRFRHLEWPLPSLVVIDGGKEHVKVGQRVLRRARLTIPIIAVAKGPTRKKFDLYFSDPGFKIQAPGFQRAVATARDEAHRFAIRYHRTRRVAEFLP